MAARESFRVSCCSRCKHPGEVRRGAEHPFPADPHQIDAARKIFSLQISQRGGQARRRAGRRLSISSSPAARSRRRSSPRTGACTSRCVSPGVSRARCAAASAALRSNRGSCSAKTDHSAASACRRRSQSGAKARSCRRSISPSRTISSEAEKGRSPHRAGLGRGRHPGLSDNCRASVHSTAMPRQPLRAPRAPRPATRPAGS